MRSTSSQKKILGQGRPKPRTDLSNTDPFKAKNMNARGQGHKAQVFSKKIFQATSKKRKKGLRFFKLQLKKVIAMAHF